MIPIFRAKKLYSDEYVFGVPRQDSKGMYEMIINVVEDDIAGVIQRYIEVDTISIHFPDMLDSQGNKIFASLQEDGKGGDVILFCEVENITGTAIYEKSSIFITGGCSEYLSEILQREDEDFKIIGIQQ